MGHTPPGVDDRESGAAVLSERHNKRYLQMIRLYSDIIRGQFFGHWHSDTFRVVYSDTGTCVCSSSFLAIGRCLSTMNQPSRSGSMHKQQPCSTFYSLRYTEWPPSSLFLPLPRCVAQNAGTYVRLLHATFSALLYRSTRRFSSRFELNNAEFFTRERFIFGASKWKRNVRSFF